MRRLPCAEHEAEVRCCGTLKLMYYVNYAAYNNDFGQFLGGFEINNHDEICNKPKKIERCTVHRGTMLSSNIVTKSLIKGEKICRGKFC